MIASQKYSVALLANGPARVLTSGKHLRLLSATGLVDVVTETARLKDCAVGDGFDNQPFTYVELLDKSGAPNSVTFVVADAEFLTSPTSQVIVTGNSPSQDPSFVNTPRTVTSASTTMLAANTARKYLLVQNKDASGTIWLTWGGAAATQANGFRLGPGAVWEWDFNVPTGELRAIGDLASNANVLTVEG